MRGAVDSKQPLRTGDNAGASWNALALPAEIQNVTHVALGADRQNLYVATSFVHSSYGVEGVYRLGLP
jgi:hypothetical protein